MIGTGLGDVFEATEFPDCLFTRRYRGCKFVVYNLKYDEGALVQRLPIDRLNDLRLEGKVEHNGYHYRCIPRKMLSVRKGNNTITIYDMLTFFGTSLDAAAKEYLGEGKIDEDTSKYTPVHVGRNWRSIGNYCVRDAQLVQRLAETLIRQFEGYGVYPQKLYSPAYVSAQYFRGKTAYVGVGRFWVWYRDLLDAALASYAGGKFEVTWRGADYLYEYDINSAYPRQIADLIDITDAEIRHGKRYEKAATYGYIQCSVGVPSDVYSPCPIRRGSVNTFPVGEFETVLTKAEYDYLRARGCRLRIQDGWWIMARGGEYPYRHEVERLFTLKDKAKREKRKLDYQLIKLMLNSFYGKMAQLIPIKGRFRAGWSWNPIYAAIITANVRIQVTEMQNTYMDVVGVHTDSVIAREPLPLGKSKALGDWAYECEGDGVLVGSGIYQVGKKSKYRGFRTKTPLLETLSTRKRSVTIPTHRPYSWREVAHRGMDTEYINRFVDESKALDLNFDTKRLWFGTWKTPRQALSVPLESSPLIYSDLLGF